MSDFGDLIELGLEGFDRVTDSKYFASAYDKAAKATILPRRDSQKKQQPKKNERSRSNDSHRRRDGDRDERRDGDRDVRRDRSRHYEYDDEPPQRRHSGSDYHANGGHYEAYPRAHYQLYPDDPARYQPAYPPQRPPEQQMTYPYYNQPLVYPYPEQYNYGYYDGPEENYSQYPRRRARSEDGYDKDRGRDSREEKNNSGPRPRKCEFTEGLGHSGFAAAVAGALAGGFVGDKMGKGNKSAAMAGAVVGALGAGAVEKTIEKMQVKKKEKKWEQKYGDRGRDDDGGRSRRRDY
ncbi:hypothetical protein M501DRAFT_661041 [Patellaria atrata CBS 101060]|uniref:Glycine zipper 2TM domain-containing protein n=1 Tax=Patellaria atrata CBS 101060 TaxID=1346257 RepID=A0A9P4VT23_9PEZI|nr:hypothetical protein M501DRAFT_661041 [Patellaria atrata CBS 101060]